MNPLIGTGSLFQQAGVALSVNLNKVALLRNTRSLGIPSLTHAATLVMQAGAQGLTVHPRPDERHVRAADVLELATLLKQWPQAEFNIEGNPLHNLMDVLRSLVDLGMPPAQCTFVPDATNQATSDHGWFLPQDAEALRPLIAQAHRWGIRVSLFMDPLPQAMAAVRDLGADRVELYTQSYAQAHGQPQLASILADFSAAAEAALKNGLGVNAGHDLNIDNLSDFVRAVPGISEVSIGHALVSDALVNGLTATVKAYLRALGSVASLRG
jgi:pyridoxine 5-phosphate synthase